VSAHVVQWVTAAPLWSDATAPADHDARYQAMRKPALLRFASDTFMADVAQVLEHDPAELRDAVATPTSYRLPAPGETEPPTPPTLKLYQAIHGHFNLVAASLVCRVPGLPEHEVHAAEKERVTFVLRLLDDKDGELAWVPGDANWVALAAHEVDRVRDGEDQLPLFPVSYEQDDRTRKLFVGLVPTNGPETMKADGALLAAADANVEGGPPADPRPAALTAKVTDPLRMLVDAKVEAPDLARPQDKPAIVQAMLDTQVEASAFLLLDFAEFLHTHLGWFASEPATAPADAKGAALWAQLAAPAQQGKPTSWRDALAAAWHDRLVLWGDSEAAPTLPVLNLHQPGLSADQLDGFVTAALPPQPPPDPARPATSIQGDTVEPPAVPKIAAGSGARYLVRCVYERPQCGMFAPDAVSAPSEPFELAGYFDVDAPARSITIAMPLGTTIKDLRQARKSVNLMLGKELRAQMNRVASLKDALDGKFADGKSVDVGLICSFSIPIITICALLVLMIFISLLNIIFWWMPFLRICFPVGLDKEDD
jgi:hypothetical protein